MLCWKKIINQKIILFILFQTINASAIELIDATSHKLSMPTPPKRIVTLAPSLGELAADLLGENIDRIVGVSENTDYPPMLGKIFSVGPYSRFNFEKILSLKPDLAIATKDGNLKDQVLHLRGMGIPVLVVSTENLSQVQESIKLVSIALGKQAQGLQMVQQLQNGLKHIKNRAADRLQKTKKKTILFQLGDSPFITVGNKSFLNEVIETIGATNIFSDLNTGYPRPSLEETVKRNPDVILILDFNNESDKTNSTLNQMKSHWQRFKTMNAVKNKEIKIIKSDSLLRPTLRLLEGLSILERAVYQ